MKASHSSKKKSKKSKVEIFYFCQILNKAIKSIEIVIAMKKNSI